jgi:hypothetical protein
MEEIAHSISLDLNVTGYSGSDLDEAVPHFMTERDTRVSLTWRPSAEGPESFRLIIEIAAGYAAGSFLKTFLQELSKDLYRWSKERLDPLFSKKGQASGNVSIELKDVGVNYRPSSKEDLSSFFRELPKLLESVDPEEGARWKVKFDQSGEEWKIEPEEVE